MVRLGEVCPVVFSGGTPDTRVSAYWRGNLPWLSSGETSQTFVTKTDKHISEEAVKNSSTRLAKDGDVVIATAGQGWTRGQTSVLKIDTYINQSLIALRPNSEELNPLFLFYNLRLRYPELRSLSDSTSSRGSITGPLMKDLMLKVPEVSEQKRIAGVLAAFDEKIENNNRIIKTLEEMAQAIFKKQFNVPVDDLSEGWEVKNVLEIVKRISVGKKYENKTALSAGKVPILDQGQSGYIGFHNDEPGVEASVDEPVVVFTNHTCNYRLMTRPFSAIQNVLPYVGINDYPTLFVYYLTRGKITMQEYKGHWPEFELQEFVIPPPSLAKEFSSFVKPMVQKIVEAENENQKLAAMRDFLLPRLMSGEIRV